MKPMSTPKYADSLRREGFQPAVGPEVPIEAAPVLVHPSVPGRRFVRQEGCPLRRTLALLLRDLAAAKRDLR